jgi:hypothetical protein
MKLLIASLMAIISLGGTMIFANNWTISAFHVPSWGGFGKSSEGNLKTTNSNVASFNGDVLPNAFGYGAKLVNSEFESRSSETDLFKDKTTHAGNNSGQVNYYYFGGVRSAHFEPNGSHIKIHFSADQK